MFLKKLTSNKIITIEYYKNGALQKLKGRIYKLNLIEQMISLRDEKQKSFTIRLSGIKQIY